MAEYRQLDTGKLRHFCEEIFNSHGFAPNESKIITDVLIRSDLYGIESHGVRLLVGYHNGIDAGRVNIKGKPEIVHETAVSAVIDAKKIIGQLAGVHGMELAIEKARKSGCGMVSVRNSNHYGMAGYYSCMAAEADLLGISMTNSMALSVPTFGRQAMIGSNPIALAMPAEPVNFSFDAATTVVPKGKLDVYNKNGKSLPDQWVLDSEGKSSVNAAEVLHNITHNLGGGIVPLGGASELYGGHKGYGLGLIVELFTAILSGGLTSNHVNTTSEFPGICHSFIAVDYGIFGDKKAIKAYMSAFLRELRESKKAEGQERIYTHGEKEAEMMAARVNGQIPVNEETVAEMKNIAEKQGVAWNF